MADYVSVTRLNKRTILYRSMGSGFRTTIEARENFLSLFSPSDRKKITTTALTAAGNDWIRFRLPDRFTNFARIALGYTSNSKYDLRKLRREGKDWNRQNRRKVLAPQPMPLVLTGRSRTAALTSARSKLIGVTAIQVSFQRGAVNFKKAPVLQRIPQAEIMRIQSIIGDTMDSIISGSGMNNGGRKFQRSIVGASSRLPGIAQRSP